MNKTITILSSLLILALIIVGIKYFYFVNITSDFHELINNAQDISMSYRIPGANDDWANGTSISRHLSESEVAMFSTLKFISVPFYEIRNCACKWNPIFTITNKDGTQYIFGAGCTLTIDVKEPLVPGDHILEDESRKVFGQWLEIIKKDSNQ